MRVRALVSRVAVTVGLLGALFVVPAAAFGQTGEGTGGEPRYSESVNVDEFVPPPPGSMDDTVSAPLMVSLAYGFIWLLAAGFMWSIWRRSRSLQVELRAAQQRLEALDERLRSELGSSGGGEAAS